MQPSVNFPPGPSGMIDIIEVDDVDDNIFANYAKNN